MAKSNSEFMRKACFLIAATLLVASQSRGTSVPTFTATSATLFTSIGATQGEIDTMNASGPLFTLAGLSFSPSSDQILIPFGVPVNFAGMGPSCCNGASGSAAIIGTVTIGGAAVQVSYSGSVDASSNATVVLPSTPDFSITVPGAIANGSFNANACGPLEDPPNCSGPRVAAVAINLPGDLTFSFSTPAEFFNAGELKLVGAQFTSAPEPYTGLLLPLALLVVAVSTVRKNYVARRRRE